MIPNMNLVPLTYISRILEISIFTEISRLFPIFTEIFRNIMLSCTVYYKSVKYYVKLYSVLQISKSPEISVKIGKYR